VLVLVLVLLLLPGVVPEFFCPAAVHPWPGGGSSSSA
jgi:hypothetical protein